VGARTLAQRAWQAGGGSGLAGPGRPGAKLTEDRGAVLPGAGKGSRQRGLRTIIAVEGAGPTPGRRRKDRWHILYVNDEHTDAYQLIQESRQRQHHEQAYRIGVHNLDLDAVPSGYAKRSAPARPAFRPATLTWAAGTKLLVANLIEFLGARHGGCWRHAHPRTLRRTFLNQPGTRPPLAAQKTLSPAARKA
jgi:hypothetical protein